MIFNISTSYFSQIFISLFWILFSDETALRVGYITLCTFTMCHCFFFPRNLKNVMLLVFFWKKHEWKNYIEVFHSLSWKCKANIRTFKKKGNTMSQLKSDKTYRFSRIVERKNFQHFAFYISSSSYYTKSIWQRTMVQLEFFASQVLHITPIQFDKELLFNWNFFGVHMFKQLSN